MKTIKNRIQKLSNIAIIALSMVLSVSCDKQPSQTSKDLDGLTINLQVPSNVSTEVESRVGATISNIYLADVWVFQFNASTGAMTKSQFRDENYISQDKDYLAEVQTDGFVNEDSRFYVIANGGQSLFAEGQTYTEAQVMSAFVAVPSNILGELIFLTAGPIEFKKQEIDNDKAVIVAPLERAYSRINLRYSITSIKDGGTFTATGATITNVAKIMTVSRRGGANTNSAFPALSNINTTPISIISSTWNPNQTQQLYIAENLRGIGTSVTFAGKNNPSNGPGGLLNGCTYVTVKGNYKYHKDHAGAIEVEYRFYLGGNLMNDYNVQRGTDYTIAVNIAGANSADVRVTITKGNVVVFDKVQEIERVINFN